MDLWEDMALPGTGTHTGRAAVQSMKNGKTGCWHISWKKCPNTKDSVKAELLSSYLAPLLSMKDTDIF